MEAASFYQEICEYVFTRRKGEKKMNALHQAWEKLLEEKVEKKQQEDHYRPMLHITPPIGWLNDPNGLCQYRGVYHAFYQFAPFQVEGGLKFWGHCTSQDLLHWEYQGAALMPDEPYDCHGAYSGSALVEEDMMYLFYTGNIKLSGDYDYITAGREANTVLAVSQDGNIFTEKELLMTNQDYPKDLTRHVRDPKVWKKDGIYYMVQGARTKEHQGVVLLFTSKDKRNWTYLHRYKKEGNYGYMWECPDMYEIDGLNVLAISPQGMEQEGLHYANRYQSGVFFLEGDFRTAEVKGRFQELDRGFDFYAPQTFLADDGRRIQIGWMGMPDVKEHQNKTITDGWQNMLTIPRELSIRDEILCQNPVRELEDWWNQIFFFEGSYHGKMEPCCEWKLTIEKEVRITLAEGLVLRYQETEGIFWMEFTDCELGGGRTIRGSEIKALSNMRILVDVSSVEVFLNDGTDVFTTRFYPRKEQYTVNIEGNVKGIYCWHL